jgi:hypothetical protein
MISDWVIGASCCAAGLRSAAGAVTCFRYGWRFRHPSQVIDVTHASIRHAGAGHMSIGIMSGFVMNCRIGKAADLAMGEYD